VPMTAKSSSPRSQARRRSSGSAFNPQGRTSCPRIPSSHRYLSAKTVCPFTVSLSV
jgi:hypothetical protein